MTSQRRDAADKGQRPLLSPTEPALRSRDKSGLRIGHNSPLHYLRLLEELHETIASIGPPCWAYGLTAAALKGFDGYELSTPFELAVPYNRAPHRVGHVVHRIKTFNKLDFDAAHGILSATRTLIEIARTETPKRLTAALDSAIRDGLTTEDFLHRRMMELRIRGRPGLDRLL